MSHLLLPGPCRSDRRSVYISVMEREVGTCRKTKIRSAGFGEKYGEFRHNFVNSSTDDGLVPFPKARRYFLSRHQNTSFVSPFSVFVACMMLRVQG